MTITKSELTENIYCNLCNRPILIQDVDFETGVACCYGCNHFFLLEHTSNRPRKEIVIPHGTDFIRLRLLRDELEIRIRWNRNYQFWKAYDENSQGFPKLFIIAAALLNKTTIEVRSGYIKIDHGPIDLLPMTFYSAKIISQFHVESLSFDSSYGLYALLNTGKKVLLLWNLKKTTLLFIEQEIERVLKIADTE